MTELKIAIARLNKESNKRIRERTRWGWRGGGGGEGRGKQRKCTVGYLEVIVVSVDEFQIKNNAETISEN